MPIWIGTSGWQYRHWRAGLYPVGLAQSHWFDRYVEEFDTVELNVTFYRQPRPEVFESWARRVPEHFLFAVKASRFLTHILRLRTPQDSIDMLMEGASRLGSHLGPVLIQLPPDMTVEIERLDETLAAFPKDVRVAVEPRHRTWFVEPVLDVLRRHGAALCWADRRRPLNPTTPEWATADWGYVRFHNGTATPKGCYSERVLSNWLERITTAWRPEQDVFAYWNNDFRGCAPRDAGIFARQAVQADVPTTKAPDPDVLLLGEDLAAAGAAGSRSVRAARRT
ncbi:MAG TPA: DUF72 domain-containing protein [Candidatus Limnocylindrales bacterium]|nr:DUF72 domain-containing protein [Candidatus Limnocylindrales bacterium]